MSHSQRAEEEPTDASSSNRCVSCVCNVLFLAVCLSEYKARVVSSSEEAIAVYSSEYRARATRLSRCRALLSECRALLSKCRARLSKCGALLNRALLSECRFLSVNIDLF